MTLTTALTAELSQAPIQAMMAARTLEMTLALRVEAILRYRLKSALSQMQSWPN
jgi:hypothetical protein